jgi:hypothetical protein
MRQAPLHAKLGPFDAYDLESMTRPDRNDVVMSAERRGGPRMPAKG